MEHLTKLVTIRPLQGPKLLSVTPTCILVVLPGLLRVLTSDVRAQLSPSVWSSLTTRWAMTHVLLLRKQPLPKVLRFEALTVSRELIFLLPRWTDLATIPPQFSPKWWRIFLREATNPVSFDEAIELAMTAALGRLCKSTVDRTVTRWPWPSLSLLGKIVFVWLMLALKTTFKLVPPLKIVLATEVTVLPPLGPGTRPGKWLLGLRQWEFATLVFKGTSIPLVQKLFVLPFVLMMTPSFLRGSLLFAVVSTTLVKCPEHMSTSLFPPILVGG